MRRVGMKLRWVLAVSALAVAACKNEITIPSRQWTARVFGVVTDSVGLRVPNATVTMRRLLLRSGAGGGTLGRCVGILVAPVTTDAAADGSYSIDFTGAVIPDFACIVVEADATVNGRRLAGVTAVDSVLIGSIGLSELQVLVRVRPTAVR